MLPPGSASSGAFALEAGGFFVKLPRARPLLATTRAYAWDLWAVAYIAHVEDHHPDLSVSYDRCRVTFTTHAIGGLSKNDFICAAKIESLVQR